MMNTMLIHKCECETYKKLGKKSEVDVQEIAWEGDKYYRLGRKRQEEVPEGHVVVELDGRSAHHLLQLFRSIREERNQIYSID